MTVKAPAGPPIWALVPPRAEIRKTAMMAVHSPAPGGRPLAIANAMARGSATQPPRPAPGRKAAGNRKRHGQWQRHDADGNARAHIGQPAASVVAAQRVQQPGME